MQNTFEPMSACKIIRDFLRSVSLNGKDKYFSRITEAMTESVFLQPSKNYEKLTTQIDFLGNNLLASDMRSITLSSSIVFKFLTFVLASALFLFVLPLIVWVVWMLRERRNSNKRKQMMNSAIMFVRSTPVPPEKVALIDQLQMNSESGAL
jgi:hypothetical protein